MLGRKKKIEHTIPKIIMSGSFKSIKAGVSLSASILLVISAINRLTQKVTMNTLLVSIFS
jgi:hypothetical protein